MCVGYQDRVPGAHQKRQRKGEKDNVGIVELNGPITVPATVLVANKHSFRGDLLRLRQTATGRHKNSTQPLTEHTCLGTAFQSGYLVKCRHARASLCPAESLVGVRVALLPLKGLLRATFIRDLLSFIHFPNRFIFSRGLRGGGECGANPSCH